MTAPGGDGYEARLAALLAAFDELGSEAADESDGAAYSRLTALVEAMRGRANFWARVRARVVLAAWRADQLSYAQLADRLGVSKQRAVQLVRKARELDDRTGPG